MKELILVRHAKSSWDDATLSDHDRPLNARGIRDAPAMAAWLHSWCPAPDLVICSTAARAVATAQCFLDAYQMDETKIVYLRDVYHASVESLLDLIAWITPTDAKRVMVVGHNPTISYLIGHLLGTSVDVPTCSICVLRFPHQETWKQLAEAEQVCFQTPKGLASS